MVALILSGCGHRYHLPGHHEGNLAAPPDVVISAGKSRKAVSEGFSPKALVMATAMIVIENEAIARITPVHGNVARIQALQPGKTRAYYNLVEDPNEGFWITVVP